jgi:hypothetical protein
MRMRWKPLQRSKMQKAIRIRKVVFFSALLLVLGNSISAQQLANRPRQAAIRTFAYDTTHETLVEGTVLNYSAKSVTPPVGAHLDLQTAAGVIDVHLGAVSFLEANHFSLANGDWVRIVGASSTSPQGTVFLVRVIQKGGRSLVLRTAKGASRSLARGRSMGAQKSQQLDGAR